MKIAEVIRRADSIQKSPRFKLIGSIVFAVLMLALFAVLYGLAKDPGVGEGLKERAAQRAQERLLTGGVVEGPVELSVRAFDGALMMISGEGDSARGLGALALSFAAVISAGVFVIQLGVGMTFLGSLVLGWGIAALMMLIPPLSGFGKLLFAAVPLTQFFLIGVELLRALFSWPHPVFSIARNVVNEAIRMKISIVFIVLLILLLAVVPGLLDSEQPLRYRVQQWLQYGIGLSYAIMAMLTLFLTVGSVTSEQRERVIWQTMSKPTAPWQYVLGKWIGIMGLNAVLLSVTAGGVYMFTEYLRRLPADGEVAYKAPFDGRVTETEDRRILENQVLVARVGERAQTFRPSPERIEILVNQEIERRRQVNPDLEATGTLRQELARDIRDEFEKGIDELVERRFQDMKQRDPRVAASPENLARIEYEVREELELRFRTIAPTEGQRYYFFGLGDAKAFGSDLALTYTVNAGSNDPSHMYSLTMFVGGRPWPITDGDGRPFSPDRWGLRQVTLGSAQTMGIPLDFGDGPQGEPVAFIDPNTGVMELGVINGHQTRPINPRSITFPPDGLEVLYPVGSYTTNFARIMLVMWIKLGFVASVALMGSTFLSFPVACLVALVVLFASESASFLGESLTRYSLYDREGSLSIKGLVIQSIAGPIAWTFRTYAELRPTANLVDGRLVGWGMLFKAVGVIGSWTLAMLGLAWLIFRNRELALYSGK